MAFKILFINRRAPHGTHYSKEQLQMAMVFGAFEQQVSLLFMDEGVYALADRQQTEAIGFENYARAYASLEKFYDIDRIYVEQSSLDQRGLSESELMVPVQRLDTAQIRQLLQDQDFILSV